MVQSRLNISSAIMLSLLILPLITLCYAGNSSSGKPSGNKVSSLYLTIVTQSLSFVSAPLPNPFSL